MTLYKSWHYLEVSGQLQDTVALFQYALSSGMSYRRSRYFGEQKIYCHLPENLNAICRLASSSPCPYTEESSPAPKFLFESYKERNPSRSWIVNTQTYKCNILDFKLSPCSIRNMFFWVIPRRLGSESRRFGALYRFHLHGL